jgi:hypothetical protein
MPITSTTNIQVTTKKSVKIDNEEYAPITLDGLRDFLQQCADLNIPGDTAIDFEASTFGAGVVVESMSATEDIKESR